MVIVLITVTVVNILQRKKPEKLPKFLKSWKWLPEPLRSLRPIHNAVCSKFKCCSKSIEENNEGIANPTFYSDSIGTKQTKL